MSLEQLVDFTIILPRAHHIRVVYCIYVWSTVNIERPNIKLVQLQLTRAHIVLVNNYYFYFTHAIGRLRRRL